MRERALRPSRRGAAALAIGPEPLAADLAALCILIVLALSPTGLVPRALAVEPELPGAVHVREIYVPYAELESRLKGSPQGVVMDIGEYRDLVRQAVVSSLEGGIEALPPVDAVIASAQYEGSAQDGAARLRGTLEAQVQRDGWVRCPLDPLPERLGSITVDDQPGWVLVDSPAPGGAEAQARSRGDAPRGKRGYLLLSGRGPHKVELSLSLPVTDTPEGWSLDGALPQSAASRLVLTVPVEAEASSDPSLLETAVAGASTRLTLSLGARTSFHLAWRRRLGAGTGGGFLAATHSAHFILDPDAPWLLWIVRATVDHDKIGSLVLAPPPGCQVISVRGDAQSWEQAPEGVRVTLARATEGGVSLEVRATLPPRDADGRWRLGAPQVVGAQANTGLLGLFEPRGWRVELGATTALEELSRGESGLAQALPAAQSAMGPEALSVGLSRVLFYRGPGAVASVSLVRSPSAIESRASYLALVREERATLAGRVLILVKEARAFEFSLSVPQAWRLTRLAEATRGSETAHGLHWTEEQEAGGARKVHVRLERAVEPQETLALELGLEQELPPATAAPRARSLSLELPGILDASRRRTDLVILIPRSVDAFTENLPGWTALSSEEVERIGAGAGGQDQADTTLAAAVSTEAERPVIGLTLMERPPRGEYRMVSHLLAMERRWRLRTDARIAILDRGIDELLVALPTLAGDDVVIVGDGVKEVLTEPTGNARRVRFSRPWTGIRTLRIEMESAVEPGVPVAVPALAVSLAPTALGAPATLRSESYLVLQSHGAVEVVAEPGPGLVSVPLDELPDLGEPWEGGRVIRGYRHRASGEAGVLRSLVHERAPVLPVLIRELSLETTLGQSGARRTVADLVVAYSRAQSLELRLPAGAVGLAVDIDGEPLRDVRAGSPSVAVGRPEIVLPLPPKSFARITIAYELPAEVSGEEAGLRRWGDLLEESPEFPGAPIGRTSWTVRYPPEFRFYWAPGSLQPIEAGPEWSDIFAATTLGRIVSGRRPWITSLREALGAPVSASPAPASATALLGAAPAGSPTQAVGQQLLRPQAPSQDQAPASQGDARPKGLRFRPYAEGATLRGVKVGGGAQLHLRYASLRWWNGSRKAVLLGTLLAGLLLLARRGPVRLLSAAVIAFLFATGLSMALLWRSPLFLQPLTEGLLLLVLASLVLIPLRSLWLLLLRARRRPFAGSATPLLLASAWAGLAGGARADEPAAKEALPPLDGVLIPYAHPGLESAAQVYVPEAVFRALTSLAQREVPPVPPPAGWVAGQVSCSLEVTGDAGEDAPVPGQPAPETPGEALSYRATARVPLQVWTDRWIRVDLPFEPALITRATVDGQPVGVGREKEGNAAGAPPFVALRGVGPHTLEVQLEGRVERRLGERALELGLPPSAASSIEAKLPPGAHVVARGAAGEELPVWSTGDAPNSSIGVDAGGSPRIGIVWTFPQKEGQSGSQVESVALAHIALTNEGYSVERLEALRITGRPLDSVAYDLEGAWSVRRITGPDILQWRIERKEGSPERLVVEFARAVSSARLVVSGQGGIEGEGPLPTLGLIGAARQETFVALSHGARRKFSANSLDTLKGRASRDEAAAAFPGTSLPDVDRLYQAFGSGAGGVLRVESVTAELSLQTTAHLVIEEERQILIVRARYTVTGPGPFRHEALLPEGWSLLGGRWSDSVAGSEVGEGPARRWVVSSTARIETGAEAVWVLERPAVALPGVVEMPRIGTVEQPGCRLRESQEWIVAAADSLDASVRETERTIPMALDSADLWVSLASGISARFAVRPSRSESETPARLTLDVARRSSRLRASIVAVARLTETEVHVQARVVCQVSLAGRDRFRFILPPGGQLLSLETRNQRSRSVLESETGTEVEVLLQSPSSGEHVFDIELRVARVSGQATGSVVLLPLRVLDGEVQLQDVDHYIALLQSGSSVISAASPIGLIPIEPTALPYVPLGLRLERLRPAFRATRLDWRLPLEEEVIEVAPGPPALVTLAEVFTTISADGIRRARVVYSVRNKELQFLILELPPGANLWGVSMNGQPVAVGREDSVAASPGGGARIRVPIEALGAGGLDLEVAVHYEEPRIELNRFGGTLALTAPRMVNAQVVETVWNLIFPDGHWVRTSGGNMREVASSLQYAKKVENLLGQIDKVAKAAQQAESARTRERAVLDLAKLEQALGDNIEELRLGNRSPWESSRARSIGDEAIQQQWRDNDDLIQHSREAREDLLRTRAEAEKERDAKRNAESDSLGESTRYLRAQWQFNSLVQEGQPAPRAPADPHALEALTEPLPAIPLPPASALFPTAGPSEPTGRGGGSAAPQRATPDAAGGTLAPGLEAEAESPLGHPLTFHHAGGDAELVISYTRSTNIPRLLAALVCLAIPVGLLVRRRRRR